MDKQAEIATIEEVTKDLHFRLDRLLENFMTLYDKLQPIRTENNNYQNDKPTCGVPAITGSQLFETLLNAKSKVIALNTAVKDTIRCVQLNNPQKSTGSESRRNILDD